VQVAGDRTQPPGGVCEVGATQLAAAAGDAPRGVGQPQAVGQQLVLLRGLEQP